MLVRMLNLEKLGRVFDVPEDKAADLIARGMAEAVPDEPVMRTTSLDVTERRGRRG
jgi:hypothetical protein